MAADAGGHELYLEPRAEVEVRRLAEGPRGAWYEAKVFRRSYDVVYVSFVSKKGASRRLREQVYYSDVRPRPPPLPVDGHEVHQYSVHDHVEVFCKDGWRRGIVCSPLPFAARYTVSVCFPTSRLEMEFGRFAIRPQLHWNGAKGSWVPAEDFNTQNPGNPPFNVGDHIEVKRLIDDFHGEAWFGAIVLKVFDDITVFVEYDKVKETAGSDELLKQILDIQFVPTRKALPPASPEMKDFPVGVEVEVLVHGGWSPATVLTGLGEGKHVVKLKQCTKELMLDCSMMKPKTAWNGFQWVYENMPGACESKNDQMLIDVDGVESPRTTQKPIQSDNAEVAQKHNADPSAPKSTNTDSSSERLRTEGSPELSKPAKPVACGPRDDQMLVDVGGVESLGTTQEPSQSDNGEVAQKRDADPSVPKWTNADSSSKRLRTEGSHELSKPAKPITCEPTDDQMLVDIGGVESPGTTQKPSQSEIAEEHNVDTSFPKGTNTENSSKRLRTEGSPELSKPTKCLREQSQSQINSNAGDMSNTHKGNDESSQSVRGLTSSADTDASSSTEQVGYTEDLCPTPGEESLVSPPGLKICLPSKLTPDMKSCSFKTNFTNASKSCVSPGNVVSNGENQTIASPCQDSSAMHADSVRTRSPMKVVTVEDEEAFLLPLSTAPPLEKVLLPFAKSSPVWESIESMAIFRKMPQEPHFHPLEKYCKDLREGMAIGLMISFVGLVSDVPKMSIGEAQTTMEERLRAVKELEENGFDVACLRMRLKELIQIKSSQTEKGSRKATLETMMMEKKEESTKLSSVIISLDNTIQALEQSIADIGKEKDTLMKHKESEMVKLKREAKEVEEACRSAEKDFIAKLDAPW